VTLLAPQSRLLRALALAGLACGSRSGLDAQREGPTAAAGASFQPEQPMTDDEEPVSAHCSPVVLTNWELVPSPAARGCSAGCNSPSSFCLEGQCVAWASNWGESSASCPREQEVLDWSSCRGSEELTCDDRIGCADCYYRDDGYFTGCTTSRAARAFDGDWDSYAFLGNDGEWAMRRQLLQQAQLPTPGSLAAWRFKVHLCGGWRWSLDCFDFVRGSWSEARLVEIGQVGGYPACSAFGRCGAGGATEGVYWAFGRGAHATRFCRRGCRSDGGLPTRPFESSRLLRGLLDRGRASVRIGAGALRVRCRRGPRATLKSAITRTVTINVVGAGDCGTTSRTPRCDVST